MLVLSIAVSCALVFSADAAPAFSIALQIAADMQGRNEGVPLAFEWATKPAMSMGNNAAGSRAITAWGVVYEAAPNDLAGIAVVLQARSIVDDPAKRDHRLEARYLCEAGAGYYPALTGGWPGTAPFNPGVVLGKMKYVKPEWRSFAMTTSPLNRLEKNPPPVDLKDVLP